MAKYRQLYTEFWSDSFVLELTPEEKYFYLYLMTNNKTTQTGIYEISKRTIETDTGYNRETVEKLIKKFCEYKKILYCDETKELMIINWIKYNLPNNKNVILCVQREICRVKHSEFVKILFNRCQVAGLDVEKIFENYNLEKFFDSSAANDKASVDYLFKKVDKQPVEFTLGRNCEESFKKIENVKPETDDEVEEIKEISEFQNIKSLIRGLQGEYQGIPSNKEEVISNKQEVINKKEEEEEEVRNKKEVTKNIIKVFEENIHAITPLEYEKILEFTKHVSSQVIIMAIEEAVNYNARTMKYISKIINSWISNGIKTGDEVRAYQRKWANKKTNNISQNVKKGGFCDYEQRNYDFDALEKQLLGHVI